MQKCSHCHHVVENNDKIFCPKCGNLIDQNLRLMDDINTALHDYRVKEQNNRKNQKMGYNANKYHVNTYDIRPRKKTTQKKKKKKQSSAMMITCCIIFVVFVVFKIFF